MSENELKVNAECYLDAVEAIDELVQQFELDVYEMIREWSNDPEHSHAVKKLSPVGKCCPLWMTYFRAHRSMMTSEILGFFKFLHLRTGMVETVVDGGAEGKEGGAPGVALEESEGGGIEMMTNPMGRPSERRNASGRTVLKRQHHTGKVKALTQKISRHLVLNRDIDQDAQFLDDGDVSNDDSDEELVVGGEGLRDSQVF